jgi:hypothetical protein
VIGAVILQEASTMEGLLSRMSNVEIWYFAASDEQDVFDVIETLVPTYWHELLNGGAPDTPKVDVSGGLMGAEGADVTLYESYALSIVRNGMRSQG